MARRELKTNFSKAIKFISWYYYVNTIALILFVLFALFNLLSYMEIPLEILGLGYIYVPLLFLTFTFILFITPVGLLLLGLIVLGIAVLYGAIGKNLQLGKSWARYCCLGLSLLSLLVGIASPFLLGEANIYLLSGLILPGITTYFLFKQSPFFIK